MRMALARRFSLLALLLCVLPTTPQAALGTDTYPRQSGVDAQHYVFRLTLLTSDSNEIQGEASVTLRLASAGIRDVLLDLTSATPDGKGMTVTGVSVAGRPVTFTHDRDRLRVPVPAGIAAGQDVTFTISYHGIPGNGLRLLNNIHGDRTAFSENWYNRARQWLPTIDHVGDKASGEFIITTRAEYQVISNGTIVEQRDLAAGLRRTHYVQTAPISSWLYSLGVAKFVVKYGGVSRGVPLSYWAFPQDEVKGLAALEKDARGSFEFFSDRVGPYAYDKLAHVEAAGMGGGTEHVSNIFYGEKSVTVGSAPVVHETAHQWFGDAVTESDWNDVWLSEGFATYFTLLYTEFAGGRDAFVDGLRRSRDTVLRTEKSTPNTPVVHVNLNEATTSPNNSLVYQKGAWMLHMLRDTIGTEPFWRGIRQYYERHMNSTASTQDLRRVMEQVSGQDLSWFFAQWLTRSGVPAVEGSWRYDAAAKQIVVTVRQTQTAEPYRFSLGVGVSAAGGAPPRVHAMAVTGRETTLRIPSEAEPAAVSLDPGVWLLADFGTFQKISARPF
ncbi:MAG: M1 family metallopeptidase [Acidobacteria bacterium]|nr:M1 family metallopeptidase [Acidobacteriota bacterium]